MDSTAVTSKVQEHVPALDVEANEFTTHTFKGKPTQMYKACDATTYSLIDKPTQTQRAYDARTCMFIDKPAIIFHLKPNLCCFDLAAEVNFMFSILTRCGIVTVIIIGWCYKLSNVDSPDAELSHCHMWMLYTVKYRQSRCRIAKQSQVHAIHCQMQIRHAS